MTDVASHLEDLQRRWRDHVLPTYRVPGTAFVRGEGCALFDVEGRPYLDFLSGLAVANLGHAHPEVASAIAHQASTLTHTSNLFLTEPAVELAGRLAEVVGWPDAKVFFANSGAEANEAALKLARRHGLAQHAGKYRVVALEGSFHGRTMATLEATGQSAKHVAFEPLAGFVDHVAYDDAEALGGAVDDDTCAVLLEAIQGEGGVRPVPDDVLLAAREACDAHGALLIIDEVQTGTGRTGTWFAFQQTPITPDVITVAKGLANGMPIGACIARGTATGAFTPGDHASTFGGNPVSAAAANAVIKVMQREEIVARSATAGARLSDGLTALIGQVPYAAGVRGRGLLLGLELDAPVAARVEAACMQRFLVVNAVGADVIRLAPPLIVSDEELELALAALTEALQSVADDGRGRP